MKDCLVIKNGSGYQINLKFWIGVRVWVWVCFGKCLSFPQTDHFEGFELRKNLPLFGNMLAISMHNQR